MVDGTEVGIVLGAVEEERAHSQPDVVHEPPGVPGFVGAGPGNHLQKSAERVLCRTPLPVSYTRHGARVKGGTTSSTAAAPVLFSISKAPGDPVDVDSVGDTLVGPEKGGHGFGRTGRVVPLDPSPWDPR